MFRDTNRGNKRGKKGRHVNLNTSLSSDELRKSHPSRNNERHVEHKRSFSSDMLRKNNLSRGNEVVELKRCYPQSSKKNIRRGKNSDVSFSKGTTSRTAPSNHCSYRGAHKPFRCRPMERTRLDVYSTPVSCCQHVYLLGAVHTTSLVEVMILFLSHFYPRSLRA